MLILYLLQSAVLLGLIVWLACAPPRSIAGFWTHTLATTVSLVALARVGIWTFPPWWGVWTLGGLLAIAVVAGLVRKHDMTNWPSGAVSWSVLSGFVALALYAANMTRGALVAAALPEGKVVDLASPLAPGTYFIANGGAAPSINAHAAFLDRATPSHRLYWGTGHGVDIVALDRWGLHADGVMPANPQLYTISGRRVVAPCAGEVVVASDGLPDMPVPQVDRSHLAGNHVILRCATANVLLGHFHQGSVRVRVGERLKVGDAIAQVGNSGNTSEPHFHIHA